MRHSSPCTLRDSRNQSPGRRAGSARRSGRARASRHSRTQPASSKPWASARGAPAHWAPQLRKSALHSAAAAAAAAAPSSCWASAARLGGKAAITSLGTSDVLPAAHKPTHRSKCACSLCGHGARHSVVHALAAVSTQPERQECAHSGSRLVWPLSWITNAKPSPPRYRQSDWCSGRFSWSGWSKPTQRCDQWSILNSKEVLKPSRTRCLARCHAAPLRLGTDGVSRSCSSGKRGGVIHGGGGGVGGGTGGVAHEKRGGET